MRKRLFIFFSFICVFLHSYGLPKDSIQISLLTVMPRPNEVYTVYGHTAIRINNLSSHSDLVFNYGTFDSSQPNFIYHFIKGETNYYVEAYYFEIFQYVYGRENSTVIEQVLNLSEEEKKQMTSMLLDNLKPENKHYLYDFLFDNCTTRARDVIERFSTNGISYSSQEKPTTFRKLIHSCTDPYPWMTFGIDLLIGNGADSLISFRHETFLPEKLMLGMENATTLNDSLQVIPVVSHTQTILQSVPDIHSESKSFSSPMKIGIILLIHSIVFFICGIIFKRRFRIFWGILFLQAAIAGCIIWFVALVSVHPCTFPNYNMLWLHPFYFILLYTCFINKTYKWITWLHGTNFVLLSLLLIFWYFIPQELNTADIPYILCLWLASGSWLKIKNYGKLNTKTRIH